MDLTRRNWLISTLLAPLAGTILPSRFWRAARPTPPALPWRLIPVVIAPAENRLPFYQGVGVYLHVQARDLVEPHRLTRWPDGTIAGMGISTIAPGHYGFIQTAGPILPVRDSYVMAGPEV